MKRSDVAGMWAFFVLTAGLLLGVYLGFGVGAQQIDAGTSLLDTSKVSDMTVSGGDGFNWLLALLGFGPFVVAWAVIMSASWMLKSIEPDDSVASDRNSSDVDANI